MSDCNPVKGFVKVEAKKVIEAADQVIDLIVEKRLQKLIEEMIELDQDASEIRNSWWFKTFHRKKLDELSDYDLVQWYMRKSDDWLGGYKFDRKYGVYSDSKCYWEDWEDTVNKLKSMALNSDDGFVWISNEGISDLRL